MYVPFNIQAFASTRETSDVVALAIFEIAAEGDEARMWENPTNEEITSVMTRAWKLADAETDKLNWGCETHKRTN